MDNSTPTTEDDGAPPAKRARLDGEDLEWASAFGKKGSTATPDASSSSSSTGGGWKLRNWSEEKESQRSAAAPAAAEEDWSFFYQGTSSSTSAAAGPEAAASSSSAEETPADSTATSSFKVPKGRPFQKRVSFSEEVKVVTIPSRKEKALAAADGDGEFDAAGNPLNTGAGIEDLEGGDLALTEEDMEEEEKDDSTIRRSLQETGAEGLIQFLMSSVPAGAQDKLTRTKKYFAGGGRKGTAHPEEDQPRPDTTKKRFDKEASANLDEDSFLDAFIDSDDTSSAPSVPSAASPDDLSSSLSSSSSSSGQEKQAKKKKSAKPSFKF